MRFDVGYQGPICRSSYAVEGSIRVFIVALMHPAALFHFVASIQPLDSRGPSRLIDCRNNGAVAAQYISTSPYGPASSTHGSRQLQATCKTITQTPLHLPPLPFCAIVIACRLLKGLRLRSRRGSGARPGSCLAAARCSTPFDRR